MVCYTCVCLHAEAICNSMQFGNPGSSTQIEHSQQVWMEKQNLFLTAGYKYWGIVFEKTLPVSHTKFARQLANSNHWIKSLGVCDQTSKDWYSNTLGRIIYKFLTTRLLVFWTALLVRQDFCSSSTTEPQHSHSHSNFSWTILSKGIVRCNEVNPTGADLHVGEGGGGLGVWSNPLIKLK